MEITHDTQTIHTYTLKLGAKEAKALFIMMGCVGGAGSVRNVANDLFYGLQKQGFRCGQEAEYVSQWMLTKNTLL